MIIILFNKIHASTEKSNVLLWYQAVRRMWSRKWGGTTSGEIVQWKGTNSCGTGTSPAGQDIISPNRERNLPLPVV
jgi:hypothetical protein